MSGATQVDPDRLLSTFLDLVSIDSPTGHEEEIGRVLEARFRAFGCATTKDAIGNIVATYPGTRDGTILVATHMDTAGTDRGVVAVIGDDGIIRSDGTTILGADDKSGLAGCLELLTVLRADPEIAHPTIEFVITVGEESGLVGSRQMDVGALRATHGFVLDTAGVMGSVTYWSPTSVYLTITFPRPQGARRRGAREGCERRASGRAGDLDDDPRPDRRGDGRQHRHHHRR
jgi:tripeptide aminopeptidase